jgi:hypothetical protein
MKKYLTLALLSLLWVSFARATNYYLRAGGTAANKGAAAGPCTTASATMSMATHNAATFSAGDTIYVCNDGGTIRSQLVVPSSGSSGNPIIYASGQTAKPVITPSLLITGWSLHSGSIYQASYAATTRDVWEDNKYLPSAASLGALTAGTWYNDTSAHLLYVWTLDGSDPTGHVMEACSNVLDSAVSLTSISYVTFQDLIVEKGSATTIGIIQGKSASNVIMSRLEIRYGGYQTYGLEFTGGDHNTIQDSVVHDIRNDGIYFRVASTYASVLRNTVYNIGQNTDAGDNGAICLGGFPVGDSGYGLVEGNLVYNIGQSDVVTGHNHPIEIDRSSHTVVRYNVVHDTIKGAISVGGTSDEHQTDTDIYGNLVYDINLSYGAHTGQGAAILIDSAERIKVYNNVVWNIGDSNYTAGIWVDGTAGQTLDSIAIFNNIIGPVTASSGSYRRTFQRGANATYTNLTDNNNIFYDPAGIILLNGASTYTSLATFQAAMTPQESASLNSDPLFVNASAGNFTLLAASPAIHAGSNLGSPYNLGLLSRSSWPSSVVIGDQNAYGTAWEIGAFIFATAHTLPAAPRGLTSRVH